MAQGSPAHAVDLVVNCFERTWRSVLAPGFFPDLARQNRREFARRVVLINNVDDPGPVLELAKQRVESGEITEFHRVDDQLEAALSRTGLRPRDLGRLPHYTDCALVALTLEGSPWLLYWDAEVSLVEPHDWVTDAMGWIETDPRVLVANPAWEGGPTSEEIREEREDHWLGYGFSDQVFLCHRAELARPIYSHGCPISWRYPLSHVTRVFEERVDAYMRTHGRLRATHRASRYRHPPRVGRHPGRDSAGIAEHARRLRNRIARRVLPWIPGRDPRCHI